MLFDVFFGEVIKKIGVCCVNNLFVYIIGGLMGVFLLVMVLVVVDCVDQQNRLVGVKDEKVGNISMFVNEIVGNQKDGIIQVEWVVLFMVFDFLQL